MYDYDMTKDTSVTYEFMGSREQFNELTTLINNVVRLKSMVEDIGYADKLINVDECSHFMDLIPHKFARQLVRCDD